MASIEIILRDEQGHVLSQKQCHELDLGGGSFDEIEAAVEAFKQEALPELERTLLEHEQTKFSKALKKGGLRA